MTNNFYFNIPCELDIVAGDLVRWNAKKKLFDVFCVKAGEAIQQTVEERTKEEGRNTKGLHTLYQFYIPVDQIRVAYNEPNREMHFDDLIFGHQALESKFSETIFSSFRAKEKICKFKYDPRFRYGDEYIDISSDINLWLKDNPSKIGLICNHTDIDMIFNVVEDYFKSVMPAYLADFMAKKFEAKPVRTQFRFRDYQVPVYDKIIQLFENGSKKITAELPPRWGKTKTMLKLFSDSSCKVMVVISYTKSVNESYRNAILGTDFGHNDNMQIICINNEIKNLMNKLDPNKKTVILINTACDGNIKKCWGRRCANYKTVIQHMKACNDDILVVNEEADFGNHTDTSAMKIEDLGVNSESYVLSITGTDAEKADKVFEDAEHIVVNLINWNEIHYLGVNRKAVID